MARKSHKETASRRKALKVIGSGAVFGTAITTKRARANKTNTAEEANIEEDLEELIRENEVRKARDLANENNVPTSFGAKPFPELGQERGTSGDDVFSRNDSEIRLFTYQVRTDPQGTPVYKFDASLDLVFTSDVIDNARPVDGFGIRWSDTRWQGVSETADNVDLRAYINQNPDTTRKETADNLLEYIEYYRYGVEVHVDDRGFQTDDTTDSDTIFEVGMDTEVEKLDTSDKFNVTAEYQYTWNISGSYLLESIQLGPAGFDIEGTGIDQWSPPLELTEQS